MERLIQVKHIVYSIDELCEQYCSIEDNNLASELNDILTNVPDLKPFKARIRSQILSWKREQINKENNNE